MATLRQVQANPVVVYSGDADNVLPVSAGNPLQVAQAQAPPPGVLRQTYSGTVGSTAGTAVRLHGGSSGTPTLTDMVGYSNVFVALQHSASGPLLGNKLRVRRRYVNNEGAPYTEWSAWQEYSFDSGTTAQTSIFALQDVGSSAIPPADELEVEIVNVAGGQTITWQAVLVGLRHLR